MLLIGTTQGLLVSRDDGVHWEQYQFNEMSALAVSPDYIHDQTLFATAITRSTTTQNLVSLAVYESNDGGHIWTATDLSANLRPFVGVRYLTEARIALSPTYSIDHTIFIYAYLGDASGQSGIVFHSTDGGGSWTSQTACPLTDMLLSPVYSQDHTLLAECRGVAGHSSSANGIHRSTDGFVTSEHLSGGLSDPGLVLAFEHPDFLTQADIIEGWPGDSNLRVSVVRSPTYGQDQLLFAMVQRRTTAEVLVSSDHGRSWQSVLSSTKLRGLNADTNWNVPTFTVTADGPQSYRFLILHEQHLWIAHSSA